MEKIKNRLYSHKDEQAHSTNTSTTMGHTRKSPHNAISTTVAPGYDATSTTVAPGHEQGTTGYHEKKGFLGMCGGHKISAIFGGRFDISVLCVCVSDILLTIDTRYCFYDASSW